MKEPQYTYTAKAPCFSVTHDRPFVLKGCSCGWPQNSCQRFHNADLMLREGQYTAEIQYASPAALESPSEEKK